MIDRYLVESMKASVFGRAFGSKKKKKNQTNETNQSQSCSDLKSRVRTSNSKAVKKIHSERYSATAASKAEQPLSNDMKEKFPEKDEMFTFDVNISCHENKLDWVEEHLLPMLETKLRLNCFLFERDKPAGFSPSQIIEESTRHCRRTIVCFSKDYLSSSWKQYEVLMAHHIDPNGWNKRIIPVLLEGDKSSIAHLTNEKRAVKRTEMILNKPLCVSRRLVVVRRAYAQDCEVPIKFSGFSSLRWPQENATGFKLQMRRKFFWTALLRALDVDEERLTTFSSTSFAEKDNGTKQTSKSLVQSKPGPSKLRKNPKSCPSSLK